MGLCWKRRDLSKVIFQKMQKTKIMCWMSRSHLFVKRQSVLEDDVQSATIMYEEQTEMFFQVNHLVCSLLACKMNCRRPANQNDRTVQPLKSNGCLELAWKIKSDSFFWKSTLMRSEWTSNLISFVKCDCKISAKAWEDIWLAFLKFGVITSAWTFWTSWPKMFTDSSKR